MILGWFNPEPRLLCAHSNAKLSQAALDSQAVLQPGATCGRGEESLETSIVLWCQSARDKTKLALCLLLSSLWPSVLLPWGCGLSRVPHLRSYDWPRSSAKKGPVKITGARGQRDGREKKEENHRSSFPLFSFLCCTSCGGGRGGPHGYPAYYYIYYLFSFCHASNLVGSILWYLDTSICIRRGGAREDHVTSSGSRSSSLKV